MSSKKPAKGAKPAKADKPELFVGSSAEAVSLSHSLTQLLQHQFRVTPWTAGVFEASSNPLKDLVRQAAKSAYGVFIFAKDDTVRSRGSQYDATRDNVIFELGLFMGKLGPENCFILVPKNRKKLKIPSDLEGFALVTYEDDRLDDNPQAAFAAACASIQAAVARRGKEATDRTTPTAVIGAPPPASRGSSSAGMFAHLVDLLSMVHTGAAGLEVVPRDQDKFTRWARNVLHMARLSLMAADPKLPKDAYVAWLKPTSEGRSIAFFLGDNVPADFSATHHPFTLGEGLAGTVWEEGRPATHSPAHPHSSWRARADCTNESYACVPVGSAAGPGGVLGFGSNESFDPSPEHISVLEPFAAVLAAAVPTAAAAKS